MRTFTKSFAAVLVTVLALMDPLTTAVATAATRTYQVGDVLIYDNPYDDTPARKGRVTRVVGDQVWVDFSEFQPNLNIAEASKLLFKGSQIDDFTRRADAAPATGGQPTPEGLPTVSEASAAFAQNAWQVGDKVSVWVSGEYYDGTVVEGGCGNRAGEYRIHFDNFTSEQCALAKNVVARKPARSGQTSRETGTDGCRIMVINGLPVCDPATVKRR